MTEEEKYLEWLEKKKYQEEYQRYLDNVYGEEEDEIFDE